MMTTPAGDDSDWADLASELGLETKPKTKPRYDDVPAGFEAQQTPGEPPPFPAVPWPQDPTADREPEFLAFEADLPDAHESGDEQDTMIDPGMATEEFAPEEGEIAEGETTEGDGTPGTGKRRRRRRRRRKVGEAGEGEAGVEGFESDAEGEVEPVAPPEPRTTADAIRDLVKNWSVPGWQEVVSGLFRPGGGGGDR